MKDKYDDEPEPSEEMQKKHLDWLNKRKTYDYEPMYDYDLYNDTATEAVQISAIKALCEHCAHSAILNYDPRPVRCLQGRCDTLERIIGRLSDLELGD